MPSAPRSAVEHYEKGYSGWTGSEWRSLGAIEKSSHIVMLCADIPHNTVLEIGAGDGAVLAALKQAGFGSEHRALEISSSAVQLMRDRGLNAQLFDGSRVPYPDASFDLVVLTHVVEHLEHPRQVIREACRVGKHVYIEVPTDHTLRLDENYVYDPVGHINFYTPKTARMLLRSCELSIKKDLLASHSLPILRFRLGTAKGTLVWLIKAGLLALSPRMATLMFSYNYGILARQEKAPQAY